jgi:flagellar hook-basal body complex protein FliE
MPIDPAMAVSGPEWNIATPDGLGAAGTPGAAGAAQGGSSFGGMLANSITSLENTQAQASGAAQALATGQNVDPTSVVMAVERARLSMQMASTMRTKAVESFQDIFHTQV